MERLRVENQSLRQRLEAMELPQLNMSEAVQEFLGDVDAEARRKRQHASEALGQIQEKGATSESLEEAITSPMPEESVPSGITKTDVKHKAKRKKSEKAIALPMPEDSKCGRDEQSKIITQCGNPHVVKHGTREGKQRWKCKTCGGSYTED
ncbi:IS1 family transposase [Coleofasciculus sp. FACHB-129]|uniref:IS1 family transposase n=1 Tax=Cyanophyceae TaxID=3028117 RepID=UPI00168A1307|nr:IS1 family transposase [Coleofasciculus sp. FACHB-129]MBD1895901.1 IS1 family transposase [Coleofasciculus sp. FACHB-129]